MSPADGIVARPWYREPWPWLLMLPPALAVGGSLMMVFLATHLPTQLVVEDYARIEQITAQSFARDDRAAGLGLTATVEFTVLGDGRVRAFAVVAGTDPTRDESLMLHLRHVARADADRVWPMGSQADGYAAQGDLVPGRYDVELLGMDGSWRLGGVLERAPATLVLRPPALDGP
jgi:hypothetical protein